MDRAGDKPKIMLLTPFFRPNVGGAETHAEELCRYLDKRGYHVEVQTYQPLTTRAKGAKKEICGNITIHRHSWPGFNIFHRVEKYPLLDFLYLSPYLGLRALLSMLDRNRRADVIHAQGFNAALIARLLKKIFKVRIVMSTQALYNFVPGSRLARAVAWILDDFDGIVVESPESKDELIAININPERISVFEQWVDQDAFAPQLKTECRRRLGIDENGFTALYVGRLIEKKGAKELLKATGMIDEPIQFIFVGDDGPLRDDLEQAAAIDPRIRFFANIENDHLATFYQAADVFIIPSQYDEGTARVMLEALSSGTPVIGSDRGSIPRILPAEVAKVIEPTAENIAAAIRSLYHDQNNLARLKANCRPYALAHFSDANADIIAAAYERGQM